MISTTTNRPGAAATSERNTIRQPGNVPAGYPRLRATKYAAARLHRVRITAGTTPAAISAAIDTLPPAASV
ncbi:hypothetical protein D3C71_1360350 [compost metagenome]